MKQDRILKFVGVCALCLAIIYAIAQVIHTLT